MLTVADYCLQLVWFETLLFPCSLVRLANGLKVKLYEQRTKKAMKKGRKEW